MNTIIIGIISLICFIILSLLPNKSKIWWSCFIVALLLSCYTVYENIVLEQRIIVFENRIETSNIQVNIAIRADRDTQEEFDGRIASNVYACELVTKSENKLIYKSDPGSARMIRNKRDYLFEFRADLSPEDNMFRNTPNELIDAKKITISLIPFIKLIRKDIGNSTKCILTKTEVKYFVNNKLIDLRKDEQKIAIDINTNNTIYLFLQNKQ